LNADNYMKPAEGFGLVMSNLPLAFQQPAAALTSCVRSLTDATLHRAEVCRRSSGERNQSRKQSQRQPGDDERSTQDDEGGILQLW
jgi:hypothetical protein